MQYSPDNFEPYIDPIGQDDLSRLDPTCLLSDFIHLQLPLPGIRDTYFKHRTRNLYLMRSDARPRNRGEARHGEYLWTDVTDNYDWEKLIKNQEDPMWRYNKSIPNREEEYIKWLKQKNNV